MNVRHQWFVDEYLVDLDGKRAAIAAGYVGSFPNYPNEAASRPLRRPDVRRVIARPRARRSGSSGLS